METTSADGPTAWAPLRPGVSAPKVLQRTIHDSDAVGMVLGREEDAAELEPAFRFVGELVVSGRPGRRPPARLGQAGVRVGHGDDGLGREGIRLVQRRLELR